jgi:hypothetical protein
MRNIPFFLTPLQADNSRRGISQDTLQLGSGTKTRKTIQRIYRDFGVHTKTLTHLTKTCQVFQRAKNAFCLYLSGGFRFYCLGITHTKTGRACFS